MVLKEYDGVDLSRLLSELSGIHYENSGNRFIRTIETQTSDSTYLFLYVAQVLIFDTFLLLLVYPMLKTTHGRK